jgi:regulator of RNase E activity RraA
MTARPAAMQARQHRKNGVVGAVIDGTVRDLGGIRRVGLPILAWGTTPGHGARADEGAAAIAPHPAPQPEIHRVGSESGSTLRA